MQPLSAHARVIRLVRSPQARHGVTDVLMANLAAYEFWRAEWVGVARIRSLAAGGDGSAGEAAAAEDRAAAAGSWDGVDDAQRDWCSAHGLVPLALTAVREVVERIIQVLGALESLLQQPLFVLIVLISSVLPMHMVAALNCHCAFTAPIYALRPTSRPDFITPEFTMHQRKYESGGFRDLQVIMKLQPDFIHDPRNLGGQSYNRANLGHTCQLGGHCGSCAASAYLTVNDFLSPTEVALLTNIVHSRYEGDATHIFRQTSFFTKMINSNVVSNDCGGQV
jgi:hypothetical protein